MAVALDAQERRGCAHSPRPCPSCGCTGCRWLSRTDARIQYLRDQQSGESSESVRTLSFAGHWPDITPAAGVSATATPATASPVVPPAPSAPGGPNGQAVISPKIIEPVAVSSRPEGEFPDARTRHRPGTAHAAGTVVPTRAGPAADRGHPDRVRERSRRRVRCTHRPGTRGGGQTRPLRCSASSTRSVPRTPRSSNDRRRHMPRSCRHVRRCWRWFARRRGELACIVAGPSAPAAAPPAAAVVVAPVISTPVVSAPAAAAPSSPRRQRWLPIAAPR